MSTKSNLIQSILLCSGLLSSFHSLASCEAEILEIESMPSASDAYNVFSNATFALEKNYSVNIETQCPVTLIISSVDSSLEIFGASNQKLGFSYFSPQANMLNQQLVFTSTSENSELPFSVRFPSGQYTQAGSMKKNMLAQLWDSKSNLLITEKSFSLNVSVGSSSAVYFSGIDQRVMNLELGELSTGKRITGLPQLRVISTSPYELSFNSENLGKLQHLNDLASIDYQFSVNDNELALGKGEQRWAVSEMTSYLGQLLSLSMTIGSTDDKPAGSYQDRLYISVKPSLVL